MPSPAPAEGAHPGGSVGVDEDGVATLARLGAEKAALDEWLATSEAYAGGVKENLVAAIARQGELTWMLARLESQWLEVAEELERIDR